MTKRLQIQYLLIMLITFFFVGCEEEIDIDLDDADAVLVAEGVIEPGEPVWLQLSYTTDYFSDDDPDYADRATVYLIDGQGERDTLTYQGDGLYSGSNILGEVGTKYTLSVYEDNKGYQASSTLLEASSILNVWFEEADSEFGDDEDDYEIHVEISNDTEQTNYYLFKFYTNGEFEDDQYSLANSSYYTDGTTLEYSTSQIDFEEGDEVKIVVYRINKDSYTYYSELNDILETEIGGYSTSYNPISNFGDDVLGYFSAWSYDSYETTVP